MAQPLLLLFAESAIQDLEEIREYYSDLDVPEVGERFLREIIGLVEALPAHPDRGRIVPEFNQPFLRELIHPPFRVVYTRDTDRIAIVRVWRSERLLKLP
jgi:plasmid stabilization system protein ParE